MGSQKSVKTVGLRQQKDTTGLIMVAIMDIPMLSSVKTGLDYAVLATRKKTLTYLLVKDLLVKNIKKKARGELVKHLKLHGATSLEVRMGSLYDTGVRKVLDDYLIEKSKEKRDYGKYWSASSAGYCMRKLVFERLGVPTTSEPDPRRQRVFEAGHIFHEWVQRLTRDAGVSIEQETELIDDTLLVKGHFDDLVSLDGKLILYDIKTSNSKSFGYKNSVSHFHRMQVGTYMYMLRKRLKWDAELQAHVDDIKQLSEGRILILEKDTLRTKEFQVLWDKELAMDVYQYWSTLNGYWKKNKLPNCTCADYEGGFMAKQQYNDYFYNGEPCSLAWFELWQENKKSEVL